jgi:hypothetical protein
MSPDLRHRRAELTRQNGSDMLGRERALVHLLFASTRKGREARDVEE